MMYKPYSMIDLHQLMVVVSLLPHAELGPNDHRRAAHFMIFIKTCHFRADNQALKILGIQSSHGSLAI